MTDCAFCKIIAGTAPATLYHEWPDAVAFRPLNPVIEGHTLIVPKEHVPDAITDRFVTMTAFSRAAEWASQYDASNILTSVGRAATQSVFHLHIHVVPRAFNDQLMLPWGTTGNPHEPHRCKYVDQLEAELATYRRP
jgi:histidine triad (HIT) family protein